MPLQLGGEIGTEQVEKGRVNLVVKVVRYGMGICTGWETLTF
jgi:hypothetical protein